jgi:hypothetical protein
MKKFIRSYPQTLEYKNKDKGYLVKVGVLVVLYVLGVYLN